MGAAYHGPATVDVLVQYRGQAPRPIDRSPPSTARPPSPPAVSSGTALTSAPAPGATSSRSRIGTTTTSPSSLTWPSLVIPHFHATSHCIHLYKWHLYRWIERIRGEPGTARGHGRDRRGYYLPPPQPQKRRGFGTSSRPGHRALCAEAHPVPHAAFAAMLSICASPLFAQLSSHMEQQCGAVAGHGELRACVRQVCAMHGRGGH